MLCGAGTDNTTQKQESEVGASGKGAPSIVMAGRLVLGPRAHTPGAQDELRQAECRSSYSLPRQT